MKSYLIQDTTREEREKIVAQSIGSVEAACDGCAPGVAEMYQAYIDGEKELRATFQAVRGRQEASAACFERRD